ATVQRNNFARESVAKRSALNVVTVAWRGLLPTGKPLGVAHPGEVLGCPHARRSSPFRSEGLIHYHERRHLLPFLRRANACCRQRPCRRRKPDTQKQRTSLSACARLSSLTAALACSGDWNMVPNRPGTCERLKKVSAAT